MHFSNYFINRLRNIYLEIFCDHCSMYMGVVYIDFVEFFAKLVSVIIIAIRKNYRPMNKTVCGMHFSSSFHSFWPFFIYIL